MSHWVCGVIAFPEILLQATQIQEIQVRYLSMLMGIMSRGKMTFRAS